MRGVSGILDANRVSLVSVNFHAEGVGWLGVIKHAVSGVRVIGHAGVSII